MPSRTRQAPQPAQGQDAPVKRGRGRPEKPFDELSDDGRRKRLQKLGAKGQTLKAVPPAPPAPKPEDPEDDTLPPMAIREELGVEEFMRRVMLGLINPTARQMAAARALAAMQPKPPAGASGAGGADLGKKEQQAGAAQVVAGGSKYNPVAPPTRLRIA